MIHTLKKHQCPYLLTILLCTHALESLLGEIFVNVTNFSKCVHSQKMDTQNISLSFGTREYVYTQCRYFLKKNKLRDGETQTHFVLKLFYFFLTILASPLFLSWFLKKVYYVPTPLPTPTKKNRSKDLKWLKPFSFSELIKKKSKKG